MAPPSQPRRSPKAIKTPPSSKSRFKPDKVPKNASHSKTLETKVAKLNGALGKAKFKVYMQDRQLEALNKELMRSKRSNRKLRKTIAFLVDSDASDTSEGEEGVEDEGASEAGREADDETRVKVELSDE